MSQNLTYPRFKAFFPSTHALAGQPLAGGFVNTYLAGTDTPTDTFTNYTLAVSNGVQVELDANGEADIYLSRRVKATLLDPDGNQIWMKDNQTGEGSSLVDMTLLSDYVSFSAAITAIGDTKTTLWIDEDVSMIANVTVKTTTELRRLNGAIIDLANHTLVLQTIGIKADEQQLFAFTGGGTLTIADGTVLKSSWFPDFATAISKIGTDKVTLEITRSETIDTVTTNANTNLRWISPGNLLTINTTKTLTINGFFEAGLSQVFNCVGTGAVLFSAAGGSPYGTNHITQVDWFGAKGDNSTDDTIPIRKAVVSLPTTNVFPSLHFGFGKRYVITNDEYNPAVTIDRAMNIYFNGSILVFNASGVGLSIEKSDVHLYEPRIYNTDYSTAGATSDLVGTGIQLVKTQDFKIYGGASFGHKYGIVFRGDGAGTSYGEVYGFLAVNNHINALFDVTAAANSYTTDIQWYGGRAEVQSVFSGGYAGSRGINIMKSFGGSVGGLTFTGVTVEGNAERKLYCEANRCGFYNLYYDAAGPTSTDIELTATSTFNIIQGGDALDVLHITDNGSHNLIVDPRKSVKYTVIPFNAANFHASDSQTWTVEEGDVQLFAYKIVDDIMTIWFSIETTTVGGTPSTELRITIPGGFAAESDSRAFAYVIDAGVETTGVIRSYSSSGGSPPANSYISIKRVDNAAWSASTNGTFVYGQISFKTNVI